MKSCGELTRSIVQIIKYVATQLENRSQESIRSECKKINSSRVFFISLYTCYISFSWMPFENVIKEHFQHEGKMKQNILRNCFVISLFFRFIVQHFSSRNATPISIITCLIFFCFAHISPRFRTKLKFINYYLLICVFRKKNNRRTYYFAWKNAFELPSIGNIIIIVHFSSLHWNRAQNIFIFSLWEQELCIHFDLLFVFRLTKDFI